MIRYLDDGAAAVPAEAEVKRIASRLDPRAGDADPFALRRELGKVAWDRLGIIRSAESLGAAEGDLDRIEEASRRVAIPSDRAGDGALHERLNLENLITVARLIRVSALLREESRGSHYREDFPDTSPRGLYNIYLSRAAGGSISTERRPVTFTRRRPEDLQGDTVIPTENVTTSATFTTEI
jgi:succinate dehydrogenase / fumarate reductase flavoprotein subunit/fumarate reductase flavoprotein subunit